MLLRGSAQGRGCIIEFLIIAWLAIWFKITKIYIKKYSIFMTIIMKTTMLEINYVVSYLQRGVFTYGTYRNE